MEPVVESCTDGGWVINQGGVDGSSPLKGEIVYRREIQELVQFGAGHTREWLRDDEQGSVLKGLELVVVFKNDEL